MRRCCGCCTAAAAAAAEGVVVVASEGVKVGFEVVGLRDAALLLLLLEEEDEEEEDGGGGPAFPYLASSGGCLSWCLLSEVLERDKLFPAVEAVARCDEAFPAEDAALEVADGREGKECGDASMEAGLAALELLLLLLLLLAG